MGLYCQKCGQQIPDGQQKKRYIKVGQASGYSWSPGGGVWFNNETFCGDVFLCKPCARFTDEQNAVTSSFGLGCAIPLFLAVLLYFGGCRQEWLIILAFSGIGLGPLAAIIMAIHQTIERRKRRNKNRR